MGLIKFLYLAIVKVKGEIILVFSPGFSRSKMIYHTTLPPMAMLSEC